MQLFLIFNLLVISIINGIFTMHFAVPMKQKAIGPFASFYRLTVQIERLMENPVFAYLYWEEKWKWRSPVRYKLQLYPHGMHTEKLEGEILMSQNDGEFDEFTFEGLPLAWINKGDDANSSKGGNLPPISAMNPGVLAVKTLELRVEIAAINQVLFGLFQIKAAGNLRDYSYRFEYLLKPPTKQIPLAGSLPPPQMEMALLHFVAEQREFCAQIRQTSLPLLMEQAKEGVGGFLRAQFYRDAQWMEYNVYLFQLEKMEYLVEIGAFENVEVARQKIRDLWNGLGTMRVKLWIMQEDYIVIRGKRLADKTFAIKKLIEKGPEIDALSDEFAAKIAQLEKMLLQKENVTENVKGKGKAMAEISSPPILPARISTAEAPTIIDFALNQVHHHQQQGGLKLFGRHFGQPSVPHEEDPVMNYDDNQEMVDEDEEYNCDAENISPTSKRPRLTYHEIARFRDENEFEEWIKGKEWTRENSRRQKCHYYFCKFYRRKGYLCKARLRAIRTFDSNLIRVEESDLEHTHEPIIPLQEIAEEDEDYESPLRRPRSRYHEIARFTDENAFKQWIKGKDWTKETSYKNRDVYFCKFNRRRGFSCKTRLQVIRDDDSNLIRVEENEVPHTHESIGPLGYHYKRAYEAGAGPSNRAKKRRKSTSPKSSEGSQTSTGKSPSHKNGDDDSEKTVSNSY